MALNLQKYIRKPFAVDAIEVTEENMYEVAKWCGGRVKTDRSHWGNRIGQKFIKVEVAHPLNERQTMAYVGDHVLSSGTGPSGFKVYTPKAFAGSFEKQMEHMVETVQRMEERAAAEEVAEDQEELEFGDLSKLPNPDPHRPFSDTNQR